MYRNMHNEIITCTEIASSIVYVRNGCSTETQY